MSANPDFLSEFTKDEIIQWIREDVRAFTNPPKKSDLLFIRWKSKSIELQEKRAQSMARLNAIDVKTRDLLAAQFNNETDADKRMQIINKIIPYDKELKAWADAEKGLDKEESDLEILYESINKARKE